jgi:hypothetical protein
MMLFSSRLGHVEFEAVLRSGNASAWPAVFRSHDLWNLSRIMRRRAVLSRSQDGIIVLVRGRVSLEGPWKLVRAHGRAASPNGKLQYRFSALSRYTFRVPIAPCCEQAGYMRVDMVLDVSTVAFLCCSLLLSHTASGSRARVTENFCRVPRQHHDLTLPSARLHPAGAPSITECSV